jgi:exo-1,4-beta-D-glucosaminidase
MTGPYDYVPPSYWLLDTKAGGAFGFNTETSPGAAIPPLSCLRRFIPKEHLWPPDDVWALHAGGGQFTTLDNYDAALVNRYGAPSSVEDYAMKSQAAAYEGERAMFEAFGRNKYTATGVIQWMLNNAWPATIWHLYDYTLHPAGGYFGTKKACEPLHVQYSYDDNSIVIVNNYAQAYSGLKLRVQVLDLGMAEKFAREMPLDVTADSVTRALTLPAIDGLNGTYFLRLGLTDNQGKELSTNFYWLSTRPDVPDFAHSTWYYTPESSFADFSALNQLPKVRLSAATNAQHKDGEQTVEVRVSNPTKNLAFMVNLSVTRGPQGDDVLPILWDDNYFALVPGEERVIRGHFRTRDLQGAQPVVRVAGWNVEPADLRLAASPVANAKRSGN